MSDKPIFAVPTRGELLVRIDMMQECIDEHEKTIAELKALLREAAEKCFDCGAIATRLCNEVDYDTFYCDEHNGDDELNDPADFVSYPLGQRIRTALQE
jgi:hypothetical protein